MRLSSFLPAFVLACAVVIRPSTAEAYELELGSAEAGFGAEMRFPLLLSSEVAVKGVQIVVEWDTSAATGVGFEVDAAITALPSVLIYGPTLVETDWMTIGIASFVSPISAGTDVVVGTLVLRCTGGPAAASSTLRFADGVHRVSATSPILDNTVTVGGVGTGMPLTALTASTGLVLTDGSFSCAGDAEDCSDGADNDGDGLADCDDLDCAARIDVTPRTYDFGRVALGEEEAGTVTVSNLGACPLLVSSVAWTSGSAAGLSYAGPASFSVPAASSRALEVRFRPAQVGPASGGLRVASSDPSQPAVVVALSGTGVEETAEVRFAFRFGEPLVARVDGAPGTSYRAVLPCVIDTFENRTGIGAQAWSMSLGAQEARITSITTEGTVAADVHDEVPGLRDNGFTLSELTSASAARPDNDGAITVTVLSYTRPVTLPSEGRAAVAIVEVEARFPAAGACRSARVFYVDGRQGSGQPVRNVVTHRGVTVPPEFGEHTVDLCGSDVAFELGFTAQWPEVLVAASGNAFRGVMPCILTPTRNTSGVGAQGWSIGVAAEGLRITEITTRGTAGASVADGPPGLRNGGFEVSELTSSSPEHPDNDGAVSAVVLSFNRPVTLPPAGPSTIARITVESEPISSASCSAARVYYRDGLVGSGQPVPNMVTHRGVTLRPARRGLRAAICAGGFVRGDVDSSGEIDISDGIVVLDYLFRGMRPPACFDAADTDDNGGLELTDAIIVFDWLFRGGRAPAAPSPLSTRYSPSSCGSDPTPDRLSCEVVSPSCQ
jgi:hypothetical protein